jgi:murein L,D-transpeptidase YcbB/YkuD
MSQKTDRRLTPLRIGAFALLWIVVAMPAEPLFALELRVSLSERTLEVEGPDVSKTYEVAVGKPQHPTPTGTFNVRKIVWNPGWVPPPGAKWAKGKTQKPPGHPDNPMKKVKIFFKEPDYYIHGTGEEHSIGKAASHGCIRMTPDAAEELARLLMEHTGDVRPDPWFRRIFQSRKSTTVRLSQPARLIVRK